MFDYPSPGDQANHVNLRVLLAELRENNLKSKRSPAEFQILLNSTYTLHTMADNITPLYYTFDETSVEDQLPVEVIISELELRGVSTTDMDSALLLSAYVDDNLSCITNDMLHELVMLRSQRDLLQIQT